jgi:GR25 family glycosyltransferase involved in LPS biosynthesis
MGNTLKCIFKNRTKNMYIRLLLVIGLAISASIFGGFENHVKQAKNKSDIHQWQNIDFIYMINLDQRPEKLAKSFVQLHPYGIYPYRFSAVNGWELTLDTLNDVGVKFESWMQGGIWGTSYLLRGKELLPQHEIMHVPGKTYFGHCMALGTIGIVLSHLSVLKDAYDSGYQTIWVMEDDIEVLQDPRIIPDLIYKLDAFVGEDGWDILFTDIDMRNREGQYNPCTGYAPRPNFSPADPNKFANRENISSDFKKIGARFGAHSMIIRRSGMKKILDFIRQYSIFLPYDMDNYLAPDIRMYSLTYDVISQLTYAISDNGTPPEN